MNVQSHLFVLAYLPLTLALWRVLGARAGQSAARVFLLCAGVVFCGWESPLSLAVLGAEGAVSYLLGLRIARDRSRGKPLLWAGAMSLLAALAFFKYTGALLALTPLEGLFAPPGWLAPLGLSFVTFQQILWLRDCYDGEVREDVTPLDYACCLTFFATATCGPITRMDELAPQLRRPDPFSWDDLAAGLYCFALGLGKKVLLAGTFANGANAGFANPGELTPADALVTILCYTLQLYFDFSGYSDMAWGMGRMMGITLPVNFDSPLRARSVGGLWDRWHITLSRVFRRCVYFPLGGSRRGTAIACRNVMIVFLLSALWHGLGWGFLVWGALQGAAQGLERLYRRRGKLPDLAAVAATFLFFTFSMVFFRADSVGQAMTLLGRLFRLEWSLPTAEFITVLPLKVVREALGLIQFFIDPMSGTLTYFVSLLLVPAGLALLACPNPVSQARAFQPTGWKLVLAALCLAGAVLLFSGVDTFIYANF